MASVPILLLLLSVMLLANEATAERNHSSIIELGSWLSPNGSLISWVSSSGRFAFGFYPQGDGYGVGIWLVSQPTNTIVWTANRDSPPVSSNSTLELTKHGRLLLRKGEQDPEYLIPMDTDSIASASMHDSGNFVLYDKDFHVIWQSFDFPTDTILGGQNLTSYHKLVSAMSESDHSSGHFFLSMLEDGNLVTYPVNSSAQPQDAYWDSQTRVQQSVYSRLPLTANIRGRDFSLGLNPEGFLSVSNKSLANSTSHRNKSQNITSIFRATLEVDGNFRLYEHQFEGNTSSVVQTLWSALDDECQIKGFCGLNSYCVNKKGNSVCECYPGFVPSKSSGNNTIFLDCQLNHSKVGCESSEDPTMLYNITSLEDISWGGSPYSVIPMMKEACERSCREDCDCWVVLYSSGKCQKYKLPIRYGRRLEDASSVALFKVPSGNVISPNHTVLPLPQMKPKVVVDQKRSQIMILDFTLAFFSLFCFVIAVYIFFNYRRQVHSYTTMSASADLGITEE